MRRRFVRPVVFVAAGLLLLASMMLLALATPPGQRLALAVAERLVSVRGSHIEFGRLQGSLLSRGSIDRIVIRDREGSWLEARDLSFAWQPGALLSGRLEFDHISIGTVDMARAPLPGAGGGKRTGARPWTKRLPRLVAKRFEIAAVDLRQPVLGVPARLKVEAAADLVDAAEGLSASLHVARLDAAGGDLRARFAFLPTTGELDVEIDGSESADGLLAHFAGVPELPPLAISLKGQGPLDKWRAEWSLLSDKSAFASGRASIDATDGLHRFEADFEAEPARIVPTGENGLFSGKVTGSLRGSRSAQGDFAIERLHVAGDAFTIDGKGGVAPARSHLDGTLDLRISRADGGAVRVPFPADKSLALRSVEARFVVPDEAERAEATGRIALQGLTSSWGDIDSLSSDLSATLLRPGNRVGWSAEAARLAVAVDGLRLGDAGLSEALGPSLRLEALASGSLRQATFSTIAAQLANATLTGKGGISDGKVEFAGALTAPDLRPFSALAKAPLNGRLKLGITASLAQDASIAKLTIKGDGHDLGIGEAGAVRSLAGATKIEGVAELTGRKQLELEVLHIAHADLDLTARGTFGRDRIAGEVDGRLDRLALLAPNLDGAITLRGRADGSARDLSSALRIEGRGVQIAGRPLDAPVLSFEGHGPVDSHAGRLSLAGKLAGQPVAGAANLVLTTAGAIQADDINLSIATARLAGAMRRSRDGALAGKIQLSAPDLGTLKPLVGRQLQGAATAVAELDGTASEPSVRLQVDAKSVHVDDVLVDQILASGRFTRVDGKIGAHADVKAARIKAGGFIAEDAVLALRNADDGMAFEFDSLVDKAKARLRGSLGPQDDAYELKLTDADIAAGNTSLALAAPGRATIRNGSVELQRMTFASGEGRAALSGTIGREDLDLKLASTRMPAAILNLIDAGLEIEGAIDGEIVATGPVAAPRLAVRLVGQDMAAAVTRAANLPPLAVSMTGTLEAGAYESIVDIGGPEGLKVLANAHIALARPQAIKAHITGDVPLAIANGALAARGTRLNGKAAIVADVSGPIAKPDVSGTIAITDASLNDPASGLVIGKIVGAARLARDELVIESLDGSGEKGETISATGNVLLRPGGQLEPRLAIRFEGLKFDDHTLLAGEVGGDLAMSGPLPALEMTGTIGIRRLDMTVPNQLPRSVAMLELKHVGVKSTGRTATRTPPREIRQSDSGTRVGLDIGISAPATIYVRGRGLDAQLGGDIRLRGTADRPEPLGSFELQRGKLAILGRQLDFRRGTITFSGSLEPIVDFEASGTADDTTVTVTISGPASRPEFGFSSVPDLPKDEILAKLLFNTSLTKLSPLNLARLASEIDKLGGLSGGDGVFDQLKGAVGISDLDIGTDKSGAAVVSAGSQITDGTYVGLKQGTGSASSRLVIDHDLTKHLKARGEVGSDGNSKIGVGVEWDY